jgi:hypothetical protein
MILDQLDIIGIVLPELEAEAPWAVDRYGPLSLPVAGQGMEPVRRRRAQVNHVVGPVQHVELSNQAIGNFSRNLFVVSVVPEFFQPFLPEMLYHEDNVTSNMTYDNYFFIVRCQIDEFGIGWIYKTAVPEPFGLGSV